MSTPEVIFQQILDGEQFVPDFFSSYLGTLPDSILRQSYKAVSNSPGLPDFDSDGYSAGLEVEKERINKYYETFSETEFFSQAVQFSSRISLVRQGLIDNNLSPWFSIGDDPQTQSFEYLAMELDDPSETNKQSLKNVLEWVESLNADMLSLPVSSIVFNAKVNLNLAISFYFHLFFEDLEERTSELQKNLSDEKKNVVINQQLEVAEEIDKRRRQGIDTSDVQDEVLAAFVAGRAMFVTSKFDKQRHLIQSMDEMYILSTDRFSWKDLAVYQPTTTPVQKVGIPQSKIIRLSGSLKNPISKITGAAQGKNMFNMSTEKLSKLVPIIKIFKKYYGDDMVGDREVEIRFPNKTTILEGLFDYSRDFAQKIDSKRNPGFFSKTKTGYGIKSFSWEYLGSDPFSIDRDISATLELYFQDFSQFTVLRGDSKKNAYRYVDLVAPLESDYQEDKGLIGRSFQQDIRIEAGWRAPSSFSKSDKEAVKSSRVNIVLSMTDYNIVFEGNGNGAAMVTINYRARIEAIGKNRLINVMAPTKERIDEVNKIEKEIKEADTEEKKKKSREKKEKILKEVRSEASKRIVSKLFNNGSVYWRTLNVAATMRSAMGEEAGKKVYNQMLAPLSGFGQYNPQIRDALNASLGRLDISPKTPLKDLPHVTEIPESSKIKDADAKDTTKDVKDFNRKGDIVAYTFLGDILQAALDLAIESGNQMGAPLEVIKNTKIATLDFRVGNTTYNLSDLPIEMGLFNEFLQNKIGKRNEPTKSLTLFINELLADVVVNRIDKYLNLKDGTTRNFKVGYVQLNKDLDPSYLRNYNLTYTDNVRELRRGKKVDYIVIYSESKIPSEYIIKPKEYNKKKREDEEAGVHHFAMGSNKSIVKNISFEKIDLEFARERTLTINQEDPYALLTNVFNVQIDMVGNNFFRPGSYIYVDPKVMGDLGSPFMPGTVSNIMGLGGYHIIQKVSNSISNNSFSTTIEAVWETSGDGLSTEDKVGKKDKKVNKDK